MSQHRIVDFVQAQRDRLSYIDLRLRFMGDIRRHDLVNRFSIQVAAATRDLRLYQELAPGNIDYDRSAKCYIPTAAFKPLFDIPVERVLTWLADGFGDGDPHENVEGVPCVTPGRLTKPNLNILALITRAIHRGQALQIDYHSISSGRSRREIVPSALIDTGLRWHVRAFDRKSGEFRDFVITRIQKPVLLPDSAIQNQEYAEHDIQWTRVVELELVPHPDQPRPDITEMDYGMRGGVLRMKLRAATAGYILRKWSVDCSPDHSLRGHEYRLWLKDHLALYGVKNAVLAPGYTEQMSGRKHIG
ncbi:MAG: WYL domain-containing protein [Porticoccaceae bacterium]|nr:WYL domain-containing protein [Porticoccaceae bacterium]